MPTGYTSCIYDGVTLQEFILRCSRACLPHMRDEAWSSPLKVPVSGSYHRTRLAQSKAQLFRLEHMTIEDIKREARIFYEKERQESDARHAEHRDRMKKLSNMREQVVQWDPPTPKHNDFKKFMLSQIDDTIDFDCYLVREPEEVVVLPNEVWHQNQIEEAEWDVNYHTKRLKEDQDRNQASREWVVSLLESLGMDTDDLEEMTF